jgi:hypothetical protein
MFKKYNELPAKNIQKYIPTEFIQGGQKKILRLE